MSNLELTALAIRLGMQEREVMENDLVDLDVAVSQAQHEFDKAREKTRDWSQTTNDLLRERQQKTEEVSRLEYAVRDLKRPREGFPTLSDAEYEECMAELRQRVHNIIGD